MSTSSGSRSSSPDLPRPAPVRSGNDALRVLLLAVPPPLEAETLAFFLDDDGVGGVITAVSGTTAPDSVFTVAECLCRAAEGLPTATSLVIGSVRPGGGLHPGDGQRWPELCRLAAEHGVHLIEWFVIGANGVYLPRELVHEPDRWSPLSRPRP